LHYEILTPGLLILLIFIAGAMSIYSAVYFRKNNANLVAELWRLYGMEIFIVAALLIPAYFGGVVFLVFLLLFNLRAHVEIAYLHGYQHKVFVISGSIMLSSLLIITGHYAVPDEMAFAFFSTVLVLTGVLVPLILPVNKRRKYIPALLPMMLILVSVSCLLFIRDMNNGFFLILFVYLITETNDSFALVFGKIFGKTRIFPEISPHKTREGMVCGVITALLSGLAYGHYILQMPVPYAAVITILIIISAIIGDLMFSLYKRAYKTKDFKTLIKGHGGVLDIYDSVLVSAVVFYILILAAGFSYSLESTIFP
jgi:phosphatidate cytidylyltransferase